MKYLIRISSLSILVLMLLSVNTVTAASDNELILIGEGNAEADMSTSEVNPEIRIPIQKKDYINFLGSVEEVDIPNGFLVSNETDMVYFKINNEDTVILDTKGSKIAPDKIKKGDKLMLAYSTNTPATASLPPQITPEVIVLAPSVGLVKVDSFNKEYLSFDGELKLNVTDKTPIFDLSGSVLTKADIENKTLIVFYTITTFSIPPQTPPDKLIVLGEAKRELTDDFFIKNEIKMIPLAKAGAANGYEVVWNGTTRTVLLTKGNVSFTITIGELMYGYNRSVRYFPTAPEIKNDRTYVPEEFLDILV